MFFALLGTNGCALKNGGCNQRCVETRDGFECACQPGYRLGFDQKMCAGIIANSYCIVLSTPSLPVICPDPYDVNLMFIRNIGYKLLELSLFLLKKGGIKF